MRERMRGPSLAGSIPNTRRVPPLSGLMHEIIRMVDVLPAPFGPRKPNDSPLAMLKSTASTATKSPKRLTSPCASTMGAGATPPAGESAPVCSEPGTSVIGEECDVIVRERYRAPREPDASGEDATMAGKGLGRAFPAGVTWGR